MSVFWAVYMCLNTFLLNRIVTHSLSDIFSIRSVCVFLCGWHSDRPLRHWRMARMDWTNPGTWFSHTHTHTHLPHSVFCSSHSDSFGWDIYVCNGVPCSMMTMGIKWQGFLNVFLLFSWFWRKSFLISSSRIHHHPSLLSSAANYTADHLLQGYKCSNTSISEQSWVADRCTNFNSLLVCFF